jgi:hypothetical protein
MKSLMISLMLCGLFSGVASSSEPYPATPLELKATINLGKVYGNSIFSVKGTPVASHTWWNIESMELVTQLGMVEIPVKVFKEFYAYSWPRINKGIWIEIQFEGYSKVGGWPTIVSLPVKDNKIKSIRYKNEFGKFIEEKF